MYHPGADALLTPKATKENLRGQFAIFREKHNWVMTWLYTMTFGSFIGYSAAFPKLIQDVFGNLPDGSLNPNARIHCTTPGSGRWSDR